MTARPPYTDSRWKPEAGGLPEPDSLPILVDEGTGIPIAWTGAIAHRLPSTIAPVHDSWRWAPRSDTCASGEPGIAGTITPPPPAEPAPEPHPADSRLADAENALMAARRNVVNALDWIERGLRDVRKARGQS